MRRSPRRSALPARRHGPGAASRTGLCDTGRVSWQWIAVAVVEALAVGYLVLRFVGPRRRPAMLQKPDVKASALVRKKKQG